MSKPNYRVVISFDGERKTYTARVPELAHCTAEGATRAEAMSQLEQELEAILAGLASQGKLPPPAIDDVGGSGELTVKVSKGLHRELLWQAASEGVEVGQLAGEMLSSALEHRRSARPRRPQGRPAQRQPGAARRQPRPAQRQPGASTATTGASTATTGADPTTVAPGAGDRSKGAAPRHCWTTAPTSSSTSATWKATRGAARPLAMTDVAKADPIEADAVAVPALALVTIAAPTEADPAPAAAAAVVVTTVPPAATPSAAASLTARPLRGRH
jgi:predicted RNase H-like HicB family nuclease